MLLQNVTALGLAVLLARGPWGARGYRVIFFLPVMLSLVIVGFLWALFLNPVFGLVNKVLTLLHAGALARPWLGDASTALLTLIVVNLLFYRTAFGEVDTGLQDIGIGSAIAVLMFALLLGMSAVGAVLLRRREVELA